MDKACVYRSFLRGEVSENPDNYFILVMMQDIFLHDVGKRNTKALHRFLRC